MLLSFRADNAFVSDTDQAAKLMGYKRSEYLRIAVEHENQRVLEKRMVFLSQQLTDTHLEINQSMDNGLGDGFESR